jgi:hypothetical protein
LHTHAKWMEGSAMEGSSPSPSPVRSSSPTTPPPSNAALAPHTLRNLLFGSPFSDRGSGDSAVDPAVSQHLDCFLDQVVELLRDEHGDDSRAFRQAERELADVRQMPIDCPHAVACKRGIILYALWKEASFRERFRESDAMLLDDLCTRVLPVVGPAFVANLGQRPDTFVALCAVLTLMWSEEPLRTPVCAPEEIARPPESQPHHPSRAPGYCR